MMYSLNAEKGTHINELELFFHAVKKALEKQITLNPKSGVILAKGQSNEARLRYTEALKIAEHLYDQFSVKGCFSLGICGDCTRFSPRGHANRAFGSCGNKTVDRYDCCINHSKEGAGFGI